jgi:hypothetical protein
MNFFRHHSSFYRGQQLHHAVQKIFLPQVFTPRFPFKECSALDAHQRYIQDNSDNSLLHKKILVGLEIPFLCYKNNWRRLYFHGEPAPKLIFSLLRCKFY